MKKILFLLIFSMSLLANAQYDFSQWSTNYKKTLKKAKKNKKPILVYFSGSDWCGPCRLLKKDFFESYQFLKKSKKMNLLYVDIPRREDIISSQQMSKNRDLMKKLNKRKVFPLVLFLDRKGKVQEELSGYSVMRDPSLHFAMLNKYTK